MSSKTRLATSGVNVWASSAKVVSVSSSVSCKYAAARSFLKMFAMFERRDNIAYSDWVSDIWSATGFASLAVMFGFGEFVSFKNQGGQVRIHN